MINENLIIAVVVLYKCKIEDSKSIKTFSDSIINAGWKKVDLVIYDNSPEYNTCISENSVFRIHYIPDSANSGVSRAYNSAFKIGYELGKKYILLLDQDTEVASSYCSELNLLDEKHSIIVPRLKSKDVIISPCRYKFGRGTSLNSKECIQGVAKMKGRNFLNSGSLVSISLFGKVGGYDETLPLYFSDFNFFERAKCFVGYYYQMNVTFNHEMSSNDESNFDKFIYRFELYCDGAYKCYKTPIGTFIMIVNVLLRAIKLGFKYKTFCFLKIAIGRLNAILKKDMI